MSKFQRPFGNDIQQVGEGGMLSSRLKSPFFKFILLSVPLFLHSCFTGIENTGKITLSKKETAAVAPTAEDLFLADINPPALGEWAQGKKVLVADDKLNLIIENLSGVAVNKGDTLSFQGYQARTGADGTEQTVLIFNKGAFSVFYPVERSPESAATTVYATELPMIIDLDVVDNLRAKLKGKRLWTRTATWYDDSLHYIKGRKFVPVSVTDVLAGDTFFPATVRFEEENGREGRLFLNLGNNGNESRNFSRLFSLTDPRQNYKHISDENWQAIQNESVRPGMTKEEVRLSRGNPSEVDAGHDYSNTMEIWFYPDGTYLRFLDGILIR